MIELKDVSKSFGMVKAVKGLNFSINDGEIVGLIGPNGAGKTTTMRIMTGFLAPDKGDVLIDNFSISANTIEAQQLIGYLPESNPLYKNMLVCDFLDFSADIKNLTGTQKKEALDFVVSSVNISDVFYRPIKELSKGYKQRVGIATALLHKPKILILDEPSEGLDPNQRSEIRKLIKSLSKNHTIVVSTHVMQEVEAICNRMIVINKGEVVADGSVKDLSVNLKGDKIVEVEIEGSAVKSSLKNLKTKEILIDEDKGNLFKGKLIVDAEIKIQPELSKLARDKNWVIWRLDEKRQQLEDVFKKLTEQ